MLIEVTGSSLLPFREKGEKEKYNQKHTLLAVAIFPKREEFLN